MNFKDCLEVKRSVQKEVFHPQILIMEMVVALIKTEWYLTLNLVMCQQINEGKVISQQSTTEPPPGHFEVVISIPFA